MDLLSTVAGLLGGVLVALVVLSFSPGLSSRLPWIGRSGLQHVRQLQAQYRNEPTDNLRARILKAKTLYKVRRRRESHG